MTRTNEVDKRKITMNALHFLLTILVLCSYTVGAAPLNIRQAVVQKLLGPEISDMKCKIDELNSLVMDLRQVVKNITVHGERIKRLGSIKL